MYAKVDPPTQWGWTETLLNKAVYYLETIAWQNATPTERGKKAAHNANKPKLFQPDFMPKLNAGNSIAKDTTAADIDTVKELLARPRK